MRLIGQLNGEVEYDWRADGVSCGIVVDLIDVAASSESVSAGRRKPKRDGEPRRPKPKR